jgi:hypothetical protein
MTPSRGGGPAPAEPFRRVLDWRITGLKTRSVQALLVAVLVLLATHNLLVFGWFAVTVLTGLVDRWLSRRLLARPQDKTLVVITCISLGVTAAAFASIGLLLLETPSAVRLAEAALVLCAVCLNVSVMTQGSRLATAVLVSPAASMLTLSPLVARLFGYRLPLGDTVLIGLGGIAYIVFIVGWPPS